MRQVFDILQVLQWKTLFEIKEITPITVKIYVVLSSRNIFYELRASLENHAILCRINERFMRYTM